MKVLKLSAQGLPQSWITLEQAVIHYAAGEVRWESGGHIARFRGGHNAVTGEQSWAGNWRVGHGRQPLGEIVQPVLRIRMRPGVVEHEFAVRVFFQVRRRGREASLASLSWEEVSDKLDARNRQRQMPDQVG